MRRWWVALLVLFCLGVGPSVCGMDTVATFMPGLIAFRSADPWTVVPGSGSLNLSCRGALVSFDLIEGKDPAEARERVMALVVAGVGPVAWKEDDTDIQDGMPLLYLGGMTVDETRKIIVVIFHAPGGLVLARGVVAASQADAASPPIFALLQEAYRLAPAGRDPGR